MKKALIGVLGAFALVMILGITGFAQRVYTSIAVDYPESWRLVKPGMVSRDAWKLLGEPHADGRGLKSLDRWQVPERGVTLHLDLWFDVESHEDALVTRVVMWKRFQGVDAAKHVDPPWE